jgi:hypothetical protein
MDETYIKVRSEWMYLYRAIDSVGDTVEFSSAKAVTCQRPSASFAGRWIVMAGRIASSSTAA